MSKSLQSLPVLLGSLWLLSACDVPGFSGGANTEFHAKAVELPPDDLFPIPSTVPVTTTVPATTIAPVTTTTSPITTTTTQPNDDITPPATSETIVVPQENGKVDVLLVLDNEQSMIDVVTPLAQETKKFIERMNHADWQMGVITTDVSDGPHGTKGVILPLVGAQGKRYLRKGMIDPDLILAKTLMRPEIVSCGHSPSEPPCASAWVQPIHAAILAIEKRNNENKDFFRPGADLGIITISNKDEMGDGVNSPTQPEELLSAITRTFGRHMKFSTNGVVHADSSSACFRNMRTRWGASIGLGYSQDRMSSLGVGETIPLCFWEYDAIASRMGQTMAMLYHSVVVKNVSLQGARITLTPDQGIPYTIYKNRIIFDRRPLPGTVIEVTASGH